MAYVCISRGGRWSPRRPGSRPPKLHMGHLAMDKPLNFIVSELLILCEGFQYFIGLIRYTIRVFRVSDFKIKLVN